MPDVALLLFACSLYQLLQAREYSGSPAKQIYSAQRLALVFLLRIVGLNQKVWYATIDNDMAKNNQVPTRRSNPGLRRLFTASFVTRRPAAE
ncbi:MAG TPA: hypothetical protein VL689_08235 [Paraburkholderia sp.]|jgi:nicotinate-nucleotide pyrophosphorylase|nr:hypothetical protein [Paraburkholderia sp.]